MHESNSIMSGPKFNEFKRDRCTSFGDMMKLWPKMNQAGKACKVKCHHVKGTQMCFKKLKLFGGK